MFIVRHHLIFFFLIFISVNSMAQNELNIKDELGENNSIFIKNQNAYTAALILKNHLDQSFSNPFLIKVENKTEVNKNVPSIHLEIHNPKNKKEESSFVIKSDETDLYLIASNEKFLKYAVYTLLEDFGFIKFTTKDLFIPKVNSFSYPKNTNKIHKPSFEYRVLYYPDAFNKEFRDWHKLDWHLEDFSIWGHSFQKLLPAQEFFKSNPEFFAWFEGERRSESLCMTNKNALKNVMKRMTEIITNNPNASFISISQNDEAVFCECSSCKLLNKKNGGPQGSLYFFLNKIAKKFPKTKIVTLAYQHTFQAPINLKIQSNIYPLFCPIELDRGKSLHNDNANSSFIKIIEDWNTVTSHLYLWDYTVQFSNYLSPFPNISTFSDNYKFFKKNKVKGLFVQGYSDVPGDFSELRQYLLAKLLWNTEIDIDKTTNYFLNGFYGNGAPFIKEYLNQLKENQELSNRKLDIYSGPIQNKNTFLSPEAMDKYNQLLSEAEKSVNDNSILSYRISKLRLALEFVFFEQSKFYGFGKNGMFITNSERKKEVKSGLNERVKQFAKTCNELGIYELSENGISPNKYYENWIEITKNTASHLGEQFRVNYISNPADEYLGKGSTSLVDGIKGHTDHNINWIGWYGTDPEIEILTNGLDFNSIHIRFLDDQRNWIFIPKRVFIYGYKNDKWVLITEKKASDLIESYEVKSYEMDLFDPSFSGLEKIKIRVENQDQLPIWRKRKNKKPLLMIDEIEFYKKLD